MAHKMLGTSPKFPSTDDGSVRSIPLRSDGSTLYGTDSWKIEEYWQGETRDQLNQIATTLSSQHDTIVRTTVACSVATVFAVLAGMYFVEKYWGRHG